MPKNNKAPGHRINEIIKTSLALEMEDAREAGLVGYMARCLVQATMPHTDPKTSYFERTNGIVTLSIMGKPSIVPSVQSPPSMLKLHDFCNRAQKMIRLSSPIVPGMSFFARGYFTGHIVGAIASGHRRANLPPLSPL